MKRILIVGTDEECDGIEHRVKLECPGSVQLDFWRADTHDDAKGRLAPRDFDAVVLARTTKAFSDSQASEASSYTFKEYLKGQRMFCVVVDDSQWLQILVERLS